MKEQYVTTFYFRSGSRLAAVVTVIVALSLALAGAASAQSRIFNGENAKASDMPAQVALLNPKTGKSFCGGAVIAPEFILTAGHCVKDPDTVDEVGEISDPEDLVIGYGTTKISEMTGSKRIAVDNVAVHPEYIGGPNAYDVAVLQLAAPVPSSITPFPIVKADAANPWQNLQATVFGWGAIQNDGTAPNDLKKLVYNVKPDADCVAGLGADAGYDAETMLCAADKDGVGYKPQGNATEPNYEARRVICAGDSGGPLVVNDGPNGSPAIAGVVSWSQGLDEDEDEDVEDDCENTGEGIDIYGRIGGPDINEWVREMIAPQSGLIDPVVINNPGRRPTVDTSNVVARDLVKPTLGSLSVSNKTFVVDPKGAAEKPVASAKKGTTFRYRLSENARVVFLVEKVGKGRKSGKKCVKQTKGNRKKAKCDRYTKVGAFAQSGRAGSNSKTFSGRIGSKKLSPGKYRVTLTATDPARNKSKVSSVTLTVVRR